MRLVVDETTGGRSRFSLCSVVSPEVLQRSRFLTTAYFLSFAKWCGDTRRWYNTVTAVHPSSEAHNSRTSMWSSGRAHLKWILRILHLLNLYPRSVPEEPATLMGVPQRVTGAVFTDAEQYLLQTITLGPHLLAFRVHRNKDSVCCDLNHGRMMLPT